MSSRGLGKVRDEALELTVAVRAERAHDLVASLDEAIDVKAVEDWDREVLRRLDEIESGTAALIDRNEFSRRMRECLERPSRWRDQASLATVMSLR